MESVIEFKTLLPHDIYMIENSDILFLILFSNIFCINMFYITEAVSEQLHQVEY